MAWSLSTLGIEPANCQASAARLGAVISCFDDAYSAELEREAGR